MTDLQVEESAPVTGHLVNLTIYLQERVPMVPTTWDIMVATAVRLWDKNTQPNKKKPQASSARLAITHTCRAEVTYNPILTREARNLTLAVVWVKLSLNNRNQIPFRKILQLSVQLSISCSRKSYIWALIPIL